MKEPTMYCKHCGKIVDADSKFCRYCGGELGCELSDNHSANSMSQNVISKDSAAASIGKLVLNCFRKIKEFTSQYKWRILSFFVGIVVIGVLFFLGLEYEKFRALYWTGAIILTSILFYFCFLKSVKIALFPMAVLVIAYSIFINYEWQHIYGARTDFFDKVKREFYLLFPNFKIPYGVTLINNYAFEDCENLTSVTIPNSVTEIGYRAFAGCSGLTGVRISDLSAWCKIKFHDWTANPLVNAGKLYLNGELVTNITIPSDIFEVKDWTFRNCENLTNVAIPNGTILVGKGSFMDCCNLTSITIPNSVNSIGDYAFSGCKGLINTIIGSGVAYIGQSAFDDCTGELYIDCNIPNREYEFSGVFYESKFTKVIIGNSVTRIGDYAFYGCDSLTEVIVGNNVVSIGMATFMCCNNLKNLILGDKVTMIKNGAFHSCTSLASVTIPRSVTLIGYMAFFSCTSLTNIYCNPIIPPKIEKLNFVNLTVLPLGAKRPDPIYRIYVPMCSISLYKRSWKEYANCIDGYDF